MGDEPGAAASAWRRPPDARDERAAPDQRAALEERNNPDRRDAGDPGDPRQQPDRPGSPDRPDSGDGAASRQAPDRPGSADRHQDLAQLHEQVSHLERSIAALLRPASRAAQSAEQRLSREVDAVVVPGWRRVTAGEPRWPASLAVLVAVGLQAALPERLTLFHSYLLPGIEAALLLALVAADPRRITRLSPRLRFASLTVIAVVSLSNAGSAALLVRGLVEGADQSTARPLLATGGLIWLTNVIVFGLWYWELDRGGPAARAYGMHADAPDFLFPQMTSPQVTTPDWEPGFVDYLYVSFTNAMAFSPTDTMPLSRWAKLTMLLQSLVSLTTVVLVIARAVNILR